MPRLEDFMEIQKLHQQGLCISEIARLLSMDRKPVRKYLHQFPREYQRKPTSCKVGPYRAYLRERWEHGVATPVVSSARSGSVAIPAV